MKTFTTPPMASISKRFKLKRGEASYTSFVIMKNQVTKSNFLDWFFSDDAEAVSLGDRAVSELKAGGIFAIDVTDLFNEAFLIPQSICVDSDGDAEYSPSEIELIND